MSIMVPSAASPPHLRRVPFVLLAAGLGSRFGGVKPLAPVGTKGEPLLVVSLEQARRAGFEQAIVVVGPATRASIEAALLDGAPLPVRLVDQDGVGPARSKPWGTVGAALAAASYCESSDIVLANGDDLYGTAGLALAREWVESASPTSGDGAAVLYRLGATLSGTGGVSRGIATLDAHGRMRLLEENREVQRTGDQIVSSTNTNLDSHCLASMNLWCLRDAALRCLAVEFRRFIDVHGCDPEAELGLPGAIHSLIGAGVIQIDGLTTDSPWHGVTFAADVPQVRDALNRET